jgi:hypothetical protein
MKLINYYLLILHLLILHGDIRAEPPSVSFMSIIPDLISNLQFIQNTPIEFNQTTPPWIDLDVKFHVNESNCSRDIQVLVGDLRARKPWALKSKSCFFSVLLFVLKILFSIRCLGNSS